MMCRESMSDSDYKITVSVRMPLSILKIIDEAVKDKKYQDRSAAIITKIQNSDHLDQLMEIARNPELQKEMNDKIKSMIANSTIEQTLETMTMKERSAIMFYAKHLNETQLKQTTMES